jgi:hypothetical protein
MEADFHAAWGRSLALCACGQHGKEKEEGGFHAGLSLRWRGRRAGEGTPVRKAREHLLDDSDVKGFTTMVVLDRMKVGLALPLR